MSELFCRRCHTVVPIEIPDGWNFTALCPGCAEVRRVRDDQAADLARRALRGDPGAVEEYLKMLREDAL